jgi:DNA (cytosine-5)-methyltransferase 1
MPSPANPREILETRFLLATQAVKQNGGRETLAQLNSQQITWLQTIVQNRETLKAVLTVLVTCLAKKIENPAQDIRLHKEEFQGGYSGRGFDTKYVTPFMKAHFRRLAMKESGWLTRSIEQPHAFTRDFPGKIRNHQVKDAFLQILEDVEGNKASADFYLTALFVLLLQYTPQKTFLHDLPATSRELTIERVVAALEEHFYARYRVAGASRLPVIAIYAIYQALFMQGMTRYRGKTLLALRSHTTSDLRARGVGDIEIVDEAGEFFEALEIKHQIQITQAMIKDAFEKFSNTPIKRYYLLTTAEPHYESDELAKIKMVVQHIRLQHGAEVIVNGIVPSLKYYLRLIEAPADFLRLYSRNLQAEFDAGADVKEPHLAKWKSIREQIIHYRASD